MILSYTLLSARLTIDHIKPASMVIQGFDKSEQQPLEKIPIKTRFDEIGNFVDFLVVDMDAAYNTLLGHLRMHKCSNPVYLLPTSE